MSESSNFLAQNIVGLRRQLSLTQAGLAKKADLTRAAITLMESGEANPTMENLLAVSRALGVGVDELVRPPQAQCQHFKVGDFQFKKGLKRGVSMRDLLPDYGGTTELDELNLKPGSTHVGAPHIRGTREYFLVLKGEIHVGVLGATYLLKSGEGLVFPGDCNHSYKNKGKVNALGIGVVIHESKV